MLIFLISLSRKATRLYLFITNNHVSVSLVVREKFVQPSKSLKILWTWLKILHFAETSVRGCSTKLVFLKILQKSLENACARIIKKETPAQVFSCKFCERTFLRTCFLQNTSGWLLLALVFCLLLISLFTIFRIFGISLKVSLHFFSLVSCGLNLHGLSPINTKAATT